MTTHNPDPLDNFESLDSLDDDPYYGDRKLYTSEGLKGAYQYKADNDGFNFKQPITPNKLQFLSVLSFFKLLYVFNILHALLATVLAIAISYVFKAFYLAVSVPVSVFAGLFLLAKGAIEAIKNTSDTSDIYNLVYTFSPIGYLLYLFSFIKNFINVTHSEHHIENSFAD